MFETILHVSSKYISKTDLEQIEAKPEEKFGGEINEFKVVVNFIGQATANLSHKDFVELSERKKGK